MTSKPIYVSQPSMPPLEEFIPYLEHIWESKILSNNGVFHQDLEDKLCDYLGVEYISLFSNGTTALSIILKALEITGEVITTPYSFVATSHALIWNNLKPVFIDIDEHTLNLAPEKIEAAITVNTKAIMPVHCYGHPCDVKAIEKIALKHNLKVIYDAAHAFAVEDQHSSILRHGDASVLSFHATKVFNTFEGGAVICDCPELKKRLDQLRNFGFEDECTINEVGLNGKMSEVNAAFGLLQLKYVDSQIAKRKVLYHNYMVLLNNISGIKLFDFTAKYQLNFSYFPILIDDDFSISRDELLTLLANENIFCRRYFYPLIPEFNAYKKIISKPQDTTPNAAETARKILCLPIHPELEQSEQVEIAQIIRYAST